MAVTSKSLPRISSTVAREDDGTIQINFLIPWKKVKLKEDETLSELTKNTTVPGFRKGTAPIGLAKKQINPQDLTRTLLQKLISEAFSDALKEHKIKPILTPKFELLSTQEGKDWQIRAITCEEPQIDLGDYKSAVSGALRAADIWTPNSKSQKSKPREATREEKEQKVLLALLETCKVKISSVLIEDGVNHKMAILLDQVQKLGLTMDQYLRSTEKSVESLRKEFEDQSRKSIQLEVALNKIAQEEGVNVKEEEVDEALNSTQGDGQLAKKINTPEHRNIIKSILGRRQALDKLTHLAT